MGIQVVAAGMARICLLVATRRGLLFLQKVAELLPDAHLTVFSFKEEEDEPPFLDNIRAFTTSVGGSFHIARNVGLSKYAKLWTEIAAGGLDLMFCVSWRYLVSAEIYKLPLRGTFVFHDSMLPRYRGFAPTVWAIVNGEQLTGVSLMAIADEVDSGDIIDQEAVHIRDTETIASVIERTTEAYLRVLARNLGQLLDGTFRTVPQEHDRATYTVKRTSLDNLIRWNATAKECFNLVRAITRPYPGAVTFLDGAKWIVWGADLADTRRVEVKAPGRIVSFGPDGISVLCGDGRLLRLTHLMDENGTDLTGSDLLLPCFKLSSTFTSQFA